MALLRNPRGKDLIQGGRVYLNPKKDMFTALYYAILISVLQKKLLGCVLSCLVLPKQDFYGAPTHRLHSSSFLGFIHRIL